MKKTVLAVLIAATTTSVFAGEIYSNETSSVALSGGVDTFMATIDKDGKSSDVEVNAKGYIKLDAEQKISDTLTGFASFEIESGTDYTGTNAQASFDDVYVGVKTDLWGLAAGEVGDLANSADAIEKDDITNEGNYMGSAGGNSRESDGNGFVGKANFGAITFVADAYTVKDQDIDHAYGLSADYQHEMFSVGASFITGENSLGDKEEKYGLSASANVKGLYLAATYVEFEGNTQYGSFKTTESTKGNTLGLAAAYQIQQARLYTTYAIASIDNTNSNNYGDTTNWVAGADYAVTTNITTFAEYQMAKADWEAHDASNVLVGVYFSF